MDQILEAQQKLMDRLKASFGTTEYKHKTYGLGVIVDYDFKEIRWRKKPWVPEWLFAWFAAPDMLDLIDCKMRETRERSRQMVMESIGNVGKQQERSASADVAKPSES